MTLVDRYAAELAGAIRELNAPRHGIVLRTRGHRLGLSCLCLRSRRAGRDGWDWIETASRLPAAEAVAQWRSWHEREGIPL